MKACKTAQILASETQGIQIFFKKNLFCCEKWVVVNLNYTILDSYIWILLSFD
jgi:hypothetical protein